MNTKFDDAIDEELRNRLYKSVHEEFVGPMDPDSEEILDERDSPASRYHAGVLHPRGAHVDVAQGRAPAENQIRFWMNAMRALLATEACQI